MTSNENDEILNIGSSISDSALDENDARRVIRTKRNKSRRQNQRERRRKMKEENVKLKKKKVDALERKIEKDEETQRELAFQRQADRNNRYRDR